MRYFESDFGYYVIELTAEETDLFFDPFDPSDDQLPSHLYHRRHRFIKEVAYDWLCANVGENPVDWFSHGVAPISNISRFYFKDKGKAMMFKLSNGVV